MLININCDDLRSQGEHFNRLSGFHEGDKEVLQAMRNNQIRKYLIGSKSETALGTIKDMTELRGERRHLVEIVFQTSELVRNVTVILKFNSLFIGRSSFNTNIEVCNCIASSQELLNERSVINAHHQFFVIKY